MKNKSPKPLLLAAFVLLFTFQTGYSQQNPLAFYRNLMVKRVLSTNGFASARIAGAILGAFTRNTPQLGPRYAALARAFVRRSVQRRQLGAAMAVLVRGYTVNFFKQAGGYNPKDPQFVRGLNILLASIPASADTLPLRIQIQNQLLQLNAANGGDEEDARFLIQQVGVSPEPAPVS